MPYTADHELNQATVHLPHRACMCPGVWSKTAAILPHCFTDGATDIAGLLELRPRPDVFPLNGTAIASEGGQCNSDARCLRCIASIELDPGGPIE